MQISQQVVKLAITQLRRRHRSVPMQNYLREPFIGRRRPGRHRLDLGDRLQAGPVQAARRRRIVALRTGSVVYLRPACFFRRPLRLWFRRWQRTAARNAQSSACNPDKDRQRY